MNKRADRLHPVANVTTLALAKILWKIGFTAGIGVTTAIMNKLWLLVFHSPE